MTAPCAPGPVRTGTLFGRTRYTVTCQACGIVGFGWTEDSALADLAAHARIAPPPVDVLALPLTAAIVGAYPRYYIAGPGRQLAEVTDCEHGYRLTSSCPCCP